MAVLSEYLTQKAWSAPDVERVCLALAEDPETSRQIRIYGTVVPADFQAGYLVAFGKPPHEKAAERRAQFEQRRRLEDPAFERWARGYEAGGPARQIEGRDENQRRLERGTITGAYGSDEWREAWQDYYRRDYVEEAQATARRYLANPNTDDDDRT